MIVLPTCWAEAIGIDVIPSDCSSGRGTFLSSGHEPGTEYTVEDGMGQPLPAGPGGGGCPIPKKPPAPNGLGGGGP